MSGQQRYTTDASNSNTHKAKMTESKSKSSVNRHLREAFSLSRSPSPAPSTESHGARNRRSSKSPPRQAKAYNTGDKRSRAEEYDDARYQNAPPARRSRLDDSREFRVHYEDSRRYHDDRYERREPPRRRDNGDYLRDGRRGLGDRNRRRSRSPDRQLDRERHLREGQLDYGSGDVKPKSHDGIPTGPRGAPAYGRSGEARPSSRGTTTGDIAVHNSRGAHPGNRLNLQPERGILRGSSAAGLNSPDYKDSNGHLHNRNGSTHAGGGKPSNGHRHPERVKFDVKEPSPSPPPPPAPVVNEGLSIEERRKRRAAILAKYAGDTPNSSTVGTPMADPSTPDPSTPASLGSPREEPSAADYDPAMDMQEDRQKQIDANEGVSAVSYKEDVNEDKQLLPMGQQEEQENKEDGKAGGEEDEDEDEEDMFADFDPEKSAPMKTVKKASMRPVDATDTTLKDNWDDPEGYYRVTPGEIIDGRYRMAASLGKGVFSTVVRAHDEKTGETVAIKIVRTNDMMTKAGAKEIEILQKLKEADPEDRRHCIRLERSFMHRGHLCMVFENLAINLREVLKKFGRDVGINIKALRVYAHQMFLGLALLEKCNILHADIKPDNVLVNEEKTKLKICDLGSAADAIDAEITPYLVSRFYRAPEIILGIKPDFAIDTWSIGCTLFEMYTGKIMFTGNTNNQMLRTMMECRGSFPMKMLKKGEYSGKHFDAENDVNVQLRSIETDKFGRTSARLIRFGQKPKPGRDIRSRVMAASSKNLTEGDKLEINNFINLLERTLSLVPEKRIKPLEALQHQFFTEVGSI